MVEYKTILTTIGKEKLANLITGDKIKFEYLAIGDGELDPHESQSELQNEQYRCLVNKVVVSSMQRNRISISGVIPQDVGGFYMREIGVFDSEGDLIAIANIPETYKANIDEGSDKSIAINMVIEVDNIDNVELIIKDSIVYATIEDINYLEEKIDNLDIDIDDSDYLKKSGDVATGSLVAYNDTNYEKAQLRNTIISTREPDKNQMKNGDIWLQYE